MSNQTPLAKSHVRRLAGDGTSPDARAGGPPPSWRIPPCFLCAVVLVGLVLASPLACRPQPRQQKPQGDQPLSLDSDEAASLLGTTDGGGGSDPLAGSGGINDRCHVCHANYAREELAVTHAKADVGCEKCHGPSNEHCGDEDNVTPPTVMFPPDKIKGACMGCHLKADLAKEPKHRRILTAEKPGEVCTDCHGDHRLKVRTRRWDKLTGKLISDDGVRMIRQPKPG